nr:MAG TPA: hypothetical protein [Caudoviricetes sp.]
MFSCYFQHKFTLTKNEELFKAPRFIAVRTRNVLLPLITIWLRAIWIF